MSRPQLTELRIADPADRWQALGFDVVRHHLQLGGVDIVLGAPGEGITGWSIHGISPTNAIDGLPTTTEAPAPQSQGAAHPNGAIGLDHVVITTPDFDRTAQALDEHGLALRRVRDAGNFRQGFRRLGPAILELVENTSAPRWAPASFWGLVIVVDDLEALASRIAPHLSKPKPAVQPGRRIATLRATAGLSPAVAFMTPEPG
ncbi:MAG: hypothetical protein QOD66_2636 [Solirubrobacteraceae bacterium]|jgi:catechol 2,3-dioxygenase-like lactoylglutathione lyase family enzyme|nr:hypothetical protein [Solirubrobacteraceae bacterium]